MHINAEACEAGAGEFDPDAVGELLDEGERFHRYAYDAGWFGSKLLKKAGAAVKSAAKFVAKRDPIHNVVSAAIHGQNIGKALVQTARTLGNDAKAVAPYAATIASAFPGIGTGVAAAINTGAALAQGKGLSQAVLAGVRGALPGGPVAQAAFDAAMTMAKGGSVTDAALAAARDALPGGELAQKAFDGAMALAHGASLQNVAIQAAASALPGGAVGDAAKALAAKVAAGTPVLDAIKATGSEAALRAASSSLGVNLPTAIKTTADVARSIIVRPELHASEPWELAAHFGISGEDARLSLAKALAAMRHVGQGNAPRFGASGLDEDAGALLRHIGPRTTFHAAMPQIASFAAKSARTPSPSRHAPRFGGGGASVSHLPPRFRRRIPFYAAGLDAAGLTNNATAWLVETGDYPSKIAQIVTGSAGRYPELLDANPSKPQVLVYKMPDGSYVNVDASLPTPANLTGSGVTYMGRNFKSLQPGEVLTLPASWVKAAPAPAVPATPASTTTQPTTQWTTDEEKIAAKPTLLAWDQRTGAGDATGGGKLTGGGYNAMDVATPGWTTRDGAECASFQRWYNARGGSLRTDGGLDADTYQALRAWALSQATPTTQPTTPATPATPATPTPPPALPSMPTVPTAPAVPVPPTINVSNPGQTAAQKADNAKADDLGLPLALGALLFLAA